MKCWSRLVSVSAARALKEWPQCNTWVRLQARESRSGLLQCHRGHKAPQSEGAQLEASKKKCGSSILAFQMAAWGTGMSPLLSFLMGRVTILWVPGDHWEQRRGASCYWSPREQQCHRQTTLAPNNVQEIISTWKTNLQTSVIGKLTPAGPEKSQSSKRVSEAPRISS